MKKLLLLLLLALPCYAEYCPHTYEVYYPHTLKIISAFYNSTTDKTASRIVIDGYEGKTRVIYTTKSDREGFFVNIPSDKVYKLIPSKNVKGRIIVRRLGE